MARSVATQLDLLGVDQACLQRAIAGRPMARDAAARLLADDRLPCAGEAHVRCRRCGLAASIHFRCAGGCGDTCEHGQRAASALLRAIPRVPVRHWVLTLPGVLRSASAIDQSLVRTLARTFIGELFGHVRTRLGWSHARCGAVTLVHRVARALVFDVHVHALVLDGGYVVAEEGGVEFMPLPDEPSEHDLAELAKRTRHALLAAWRRRCEKSDGERLRSLLVEHAAAQGPVVATAVRRLAVDRVTPRTTPTGVGARNEGVGVHAMPRIEGEARGALTRLAHYLVRAPVALGRFDRGSPGRVIHRLARPFADGSTHVEFSADELARRLVGLASAEPVHRVSYHGALAPGALAKWRARAVQLVLVEPGPKIVGPPRTRATADAWPPATCTRCGGALAVIAIDERSEPQVLEKAAGM